MLKTAERIDILKTMKKFGLDSSLTRDYTPEQLITCFQNIDAEGLKSDAYNSLENLQRALVANPGFPEHFAQLLHNGVSAAWIDQWLEEEADSGCPISEFSVEELKNLAALSLPTMTLTHNYARFYLPHGLDATAVQAVTENICFFWLELPKNLGELSDAERKLFEYPFLTGYIKTQMLRTVLPKLAENPALVHFLEWLNNNKIEISFTREDWEKLSVITDDDCSGIAEIHSTLCENEDRTACFLRIWLGNGALLGDLTTFSRWIMSRDMKEVDVALSTQISYLNALYGGYLSGIPFDSIAGYAYPLLSYAIINRQKTFLRMLQENFKVFQNLPYDSILFSPDFFTRLPLNSITASNLKECASLDSNGNHASCLEFLEQRMYTFQELKALAPLPGRYAKLYRLLSIPRVDDRLLTLRQLAKRNLLRDSITQEQLVTLAMRLSEQSLLTWRDRAFAHIKDLTPQLTIDLLSLHDRIRRFLPDLRNANEVSFLLRHCDVLDDYENWGDVQSNIEQIDTAWTWLREELGLDDAFVSKHEQEILGFLYREGASIVQTYSRKLRDSEGFYRIVRAVLMGEYSQLKYHDGDLQLEISHPLTKRQKLLWMDNTQIEDGRITVEERDDFFTTMQIGVIPQRTCLDYTNGACRECLLACFDSNKKFLYASINGRPVARAMLRLTKGSFTSQNDAQKKSLEFADLRKPQAGRAIAHGSEELVLFLERSYTNGVDDHVAAQIQRLFISLAERKAKELGARIVLSSEYRAVAAGQQYTAMNYYLYISKSKGGAQYLDSLGGSTSVSSEGSYKSNIFMLQV